MRNEAKVAGRPGNIGELDIHSGLQEVKLWSIQR